MDHTKEDTRDSPVCRGSAQLISKALSLSFPEGKLNLDPLSNSQGWSLDHRTVPKAENE